MNVNDEMAAALMHEVKNPVGLIKMNVEYIKSKSENRWQKNFSVIEKELSKLNRLFDDYKTLLTNTNDENKEKIFLCDLINDIIEEYDISLAEKEIHFEIDCDENISIWGDYNKICILFFNIIKNAVEAIPQKGSISVSAVSSGGRAEVKICDDGTGIPQDIEKNMGKPFVTSKPGGSGLGIVICRSIVREHGGSISIQNRKEGGCTAEVVLNVKPGGDN